MLTYRVAAALVLGVFLLVPGAAYAFENPACIVPVRELPSWCPNAPQAKVAKTQQPHYAARKPARIARAAQPEAAPQNDYAFVVPAAPVIHAAIAIAGGMVERAASLLGSTAQQLGLPPRLWCGDFMAMIAPQAAKRLDNPRWALDWAELPHTTPHVGAGVVFRGHVGIVAGFDARGNPDVISGNHGRRVGRGIYPKERVVAYVNLE